MTHETQTNKNLLKEYQQFILSKQSQNIRDAFYENIIIRTHIRHANSKNELGYDDLIKYIKEDYKFSHLPSLIIDESLKSLLAENKINRVNNNLILPESTQTKIQKNVDDFDILKENIDIELSALLKITISSITIEQNKAIIKNFHVFVNEVLKINGNIAVKLFLEKKPTMDITDGRFQVIYQTKINKTLDKKYHKSLDNMFNEYLLKPSIELSRYLFACAQGYVLYEILNLDPEFKKMENISWQKKRIYVDTNILIHLVFPISSEHNSSKILIEQTRKLGAKLIITQKTIDEFSHVLENFNSNAKIINFKPQLSALYEESHNDNPILSTYINEVSINRKYDSEAFIRTYGNFVDILQHEYGITVEDVVGIGENSNNEKLKDNIAFRGHGKSPNVINHDHYNILRVNQIRQNIESDEIGPSSWLLTNDRTLTRAEFDTYGKDHITACVLSDIWLQIISPFISPNLLNDAGYAFSQLLSGNFNSSKINIANLNTLLSLFVDDTKFSVDQFRKIIGDEFIKQNLKKVQKMIDEGDEVTFKDVKGIVDKSIDVVKKDFDEKHQKLDAMHVKEIAHMKNNISQLKNTVFDLQNEKNTIIKKTSYRIKNTQWVAVGIIASFIINIVAYYIFSNHFEMDLNEIVSNLLIMLIAECTFIFAHIYFINRNK